MQFSAAQPQQASVAQMPITHTNKRKLNLSFLVSTRFLLIILIVMQAVGLYFGFKPPFLYEQNLQRQILDEVSSLTTINPFENPVMTSVADAESLRSENDIQAEVYKDVNDGDFVIGFTDKIVVYRRGQNKIIYEGPGPQAILQENTKKIVQAVVSASVEAKLIPADYDGQPGLSAIAEADIARLKQIEGKFYENVQAGDIIATFGEEGIIVLFRPETGKVVNSGILTTSIQ